MIFIIIFLNICLLIFLYKKNKNNSFLNFKNKRNILFFILSGIFAIIASLLIESILEFILDLIFSNSYTIVDNEKIWNNLFIKGIYYFIDCLIIVALVEELAKNLPTLFIIDENSYSYKTKIDCIIPFVITAVIFSIVEDIIYIINYGELTSFIRLLTEFCGHTLWGLITGEGFYRYVINNSVYSLLYKMRNDKIINNYNFSTFPDTILIKTFVTIIITHALFDFFAFMEITILLLILNIISIIVFFLYIKKLKNSNLYDDKIELLMKYQNVFSKEQLIDYINNNIKYF